jgi:hypothetical protein
MLGQRSTWIAILAVAALFAVGCSDSSSDNRARVQFLHASPDAPTVDILVDDEVVIGGVPFGVASDFFRFAPGTRNVKVQASGSGATVIDLDVDL